MNRVFSPLLKSLLKSMLVLMMTSSAAYAVAEKPPVPAAKPDPAKGEALYNSGDASRNIIACVSCHGAAGNSTITVNPRLAGQHASYLVKQLKDFSSPTRANAVMSLMAKSLSDEDMKNLAAYLSVQVPKPGAARNKETLELGKRIWRGGIAAKNVPACAGCHSPNGAGIPNQYPRLAGQHQDYTVAQLTSFGSGTRSNSAPMVTIAERLSKKEIDAVADYLAGLK
jgi:cytochrome c553